MANMKRNGKVATATVTWPSQSKGSRRGSSFTLSHICMRTKHQQWDQYSLLKQQGQGRLLAVKIKQQQKQNNIRKMAKLID